MRTLALVLALLCCGCPGFTQALATVADISQGMAAAIDLAEVGSDIYFRRHPHSHNEGEVRNSIFTARVALSALESARRAAQSADDGDLVAAKDNAKQAYEQMQALLIELGIDAGKAPPGGAENDDMPIPQPFQLPTGPELGL